MHYKEIKVFREFGKAAKTVMVVVTAHRWMLLLPARKILLHKELLVSSSWPFKMSIHKHALCDTCSGGTGARLRRCSRSSREGAQERPRTSTDLNGGSAEHYLFRCNNTNLCGLFRNDKTKRIPKNAFPVWLPEPHCKAHRVCNIQRWPEAKLLSFRASECRTRAAFQTGKVLRCCRV